MFLDILRAMFGLLATLGLFALAVWAARRYGGQGFLQLKLNSQRRIAFVETLYLDGSHRLALVRVDGSERLILLGEGVELGAPLSTPMLEKTDR